MKRRIKPLTLFGALLVAGLVVLAWSMRQEKVASGAVIGTQITLRSNKGNVISWDDPDANNAMIPVYVGKAWTEAYRAHGVSQGYASAHKPADATSDSP